MIVGKIRVESYRPMTLGIFDEKNRIHATAVSGKDDLQAICDGYNAFVDLQGGIVVGHNFKDDTGPVDIDTQQPPEEHDVIHDAIRKHRMGLIDTVERDRIVLDYLKVDHQKLWDIDVSAPTDQPRRGRGRPRKEQAATE